MNNESDSLWATVFVCESLTVSGAFESSACHSLSDIIVSIVGYIAIGNKNDNRFDPTPYDQASRVIVTVIYVYTLWLLMDFVALQGSHLCMHKLLETLLSTLAKETRRHILP